MAHTHLFTHKKNVFNTLLIISVLSCVFFSAFNLKHGFYIVAAIEFLFAFLAIVLMIYLKKIKTKKTFQIISEVYLLFLISTIMCALYYHAHSISIFVWILLIPLISYQLTGLQRGTLYTIISLSVATLIFVIKFNTELQTLSTATIGDLAFSTIVVWILAFTYEKSNTDIKQQLTHLATTDPLTQLRNRSTLSNMFDSNDQYVGLVVLDIDLFKSINDNYGHDAGDQVLVAVAQQLKTVIGESGMVFRLGGEEFGVLLPEHTLAEAHQLAEKMVVHLRQHPFVYENQAIKITISAGVASNHVDVANQKNKTSQSLSDLMKIADDCLYQAKKSGRNQVVSHIDHQ